MSPQQQRPKLTITKKFILDSKGHYRFCNPDYPVVKNSTLVISLHPGTEYSRKTGQPYPYLDIRTEKQLARFLLDQFGEGEYKLFGHLKGREGMYVFWHGEVSTDGWIFIMKEYDKTDIIDIEKDLNTVNSEEERYEIEELADSFKEMAKEDSKAKKYGFSPFLLSSGRRGQWHSWSEEEVDYEVKQLKKVIKKENREMTLKEMNKF